MLAGVCVGWEHGVASFFGTSLGSGTRFETRYKDGRPPLFCLGLVFTRFISSSLCLSNNLLSLSVNDTSDTMKTSSFAQLLSLASVATAAMPKCAVRRLKMSTINRLLANAR